MPEAVIGKDAVTGELITMNSRKRRGGMRILKRIALVVIITLLNVLAISDLSRVAALELNGNEDFVPLATQGFLTAVDGAHPEGSRRNSYMWSMRWWNDKLYVGTVRDVLCWRGGASPRSMQPYARRR